MVNPGNRCKGAFALILGMGLSGAAGAASWTAPWVETGDLQARHHIEALSAQGCFDGLTLTWPLNWSAVAHGLNGASDACLASEHAAWLRARLDRAKNAGRTATLTVGGANEEPLFRHYGDQPRGEADASAAVSVTGRRFAARVRAQYVDNDREDREARLDGSYVAGRFGNWQLGAGAIDRWWGPGWQSSLALSNNARPVTGLWFGRQTPYAPRSRWFSWLGPWDFQGFAGQLEQDRAVPDAKLIGGRFTFRPAGFLQIGLTRLFQWGGEGRPDGLDSFKDALIGKDNGQSTGFAEDDDPSNQVAGLDFRASFPVFGVPTGFYGQAMGEDEAGGLPSKFSTLAGLDLLTGLGEGNQRIFLEASDTVAGRTFSDTRYNTAYEHSTYRSGFRYYGRSLASTFEGDARTLTLGLQQFFRNGWVATAALTNATLNAEGGKRAVIADGGAEILQAAYEQDVVVAELRLEHGLLGGRMTWALAASDDPIDTFDGERERVTAMAQWQRSFAW